MACEFQRHWRVIPAEPTRRLHGRYKFAYDPTQLSADLIGGQSFLNNGSDDGDAARFIPYYLGSCALIREDGLFDVEVADKRSSNASERNREDELELTSCVNLKPYSSSLPLGFPLS
jgi:hypothetical protein